MIANDLNCLNCAYNSYNLSGLQLSDKFSITEKEKGVKDEFKRNFHMLYRCIDRFIFV